MQDVAVAHSDLAGNLIVLAVLALGAVFVLRGLWLLRNAKGTVGPGVAAERGRQRCMAWVVAGCMFLSIPALVGIVSTPPQEGRPSASAYN